MHYATAKFTVLRDMVTGYCPHGLCERERPESLNIAQAEETVAGCKTNNSMAFYINIWPERAQRLTD